MRSRLRGSFRSLRTKLVLAFLGVALVAVGVLALLVGRATSGAFREYLAGRQSDGAAGMRGMMDEMMGPAASQQMMERMVGPAEEAYLAAINNALWIAGLIAALVAVTLGLLLARRITRPLGDLNRAARQVADLLSRACLYCFGNAGRTGIVEAVHACSPITSSTASMMFV